MSRQTNIRISSDSPSFDAESSSFTNGHSGTKSCEPQDNLKLHVGTSYLDLITEEESGEDHDEKHDVHPTRRFSGSEGGGSDAELHAARNPVKVVTGRRMKYIFLMGVTILFALLTSHFLKGSHSALTDCESRVGRSIETTATARVPGPVHKAQGEEEPPTRPTLTTNTGGTRPDEDPSQVPASCSFRNSTQFAYAMQMIGLFVAVVVVTILHDHIQSRQIRQMKGLAERAAAIVGEIYPESVKKQLLAEEKTGNNPGQTKCSAAGDNASGESDTHGGEEAGGFTNNHSIAELYTDVTLMFADIAGFTAWSSMREPNQVSRCCRLL
jgi:hypothetical protein